MGDPEAMLQALREQDGACFDPVRFRFIEALAGRAASHQGELRRLLDSKLALALQDYRTRLEEGDPRRPRQTLAERDAGRGRRLLRELLAHVREAAQEAPSGGSLGAGTEVAGQADGELKSVAFFRDTWLNLSVNQQLSSALAQAPENAGPLNSHILALQSLELMRDISPAYLRHFMSYVDGLLWLELAESAGKPVPKAAAVRGERDKRRKPGRAKPG